MRYTRITGAVGHFSLRQPQGNMGWGTNHFDWARVILHSFPSITIGWWGSTFVAQSYIGMKKIVKNCRSVEFDKMPAVISNLRVGGGLFAQTYRPVRTCCLGRNPTLATANVILFKGWKCCNVVLVVTWPRQPLLLPLLVLLQLLLNVT